MPTFSPEIVPVLVSDLRGAVNERLAQDDVTLDEIISAATTFLNCALQHATSQEDREAYLEDAIRQLRQAVYGPCGNA